MSSSRRARSKRKYRQQQRQNERQVPWEDWPDDIFCDLCGWGDTVRNQGYPDDPHHFCHRHKADDVQAYMRGDIESYWEWKAGRYVPDPDDFADGMH